MAPAGDWRRRISFTSSPASRCGTNRRAAGRTSIIWRFRPDTKTDGRKWNKMRAAAMPPFCFFCAQRWIRAAITNDFNIGNSGNARNARGACGSERAIIDRGRREFLRRGQFSSGVGRLTADLDRRALDGPRRERKRDSRNDRNAAGAEVSAGESLAHRALDASGVVWFAGTVGGADRRSGGWNRDPGARAVSGARRIRTLLYAGRREGRIPAA